MNQLLRLYPSQDKTDGKDGHFADLVSELILSIGMMKDKQSSILSYNANQTKPTYKEVREIETIPSKMNSSEYVLDKMLELSSSHPYPTQNYFANVLPLPNIPSLIGAITMNLLNGNNLWDVYGPAGAMAETKVISMLRKIIGQEYSNAWGYTTWGGQGAVFTSLRLAITKQFPRASEEGVPNNLYCFCSELAHYSLYKSMEATGIGTNRLIKVKTLKDHSLDVNDLKAKMEEVILKGGIPLYILATTGATDHFAIDNIQDIKEIATSITDEYGIEMPYIHADSALGGLYVLFNEYDFESNPYGFSTQTNKALLSILDKIKHIRLADSLCFDFHKLGQTPYTTSLFMVKNEEDLSLLDIDSYESPYIGDREYGSYHTGYTLECSRSASSIPIYASLIGLGLEGYQKLLAQYVEVNLSFRDKLTKEIPELAITNMDNISPITTFRLYDSISGRSEWNEELNGHKTKQDVESVNKLNELFFNQLEKERQKFFFGDTKKVCLVPTINSEETIPVYSAKFVSISPYTNVEHMEEIIQHLKNIAEQTINQSNDSHKHSFSLNGCL